MFGRKKNAVQKSPGAAPRDVYDGLRALALDAVANGLDASYSLHADVAGLVVDVPSEGGYATIVALTDGTTSMYTSTGGGQIGAGSHPEVAAATRRLLTEVQRHLGEFPSPDDRALPPPSHARLHVLGPTAARYADVPTDAFWGSVTYPLTPVIARVKDVISALRAVERD